MALPRRRPVADKRRVAVIAADAGRLLRLREPLLRAIVAQGHKLLCMTGRAGKADLPALAALGAQTAPYPLGNDRIGPLLDGSGIDSLGTSLSHWNPSVVLGIGLKPSVMAAQAARQLHATRMVLVVPRLGPLERQPGWLLRRQVRRAMRRANALVVHNQLHEATLRRLGLVPPTMGVHVLAGAGVDLAHYLPTPLPSLDDGLVVTMITRRSTSKGIIEFCQAARRVKAKAPATRFVLATWSGTDKQPGDIDLKALTRYSDCVHLTLAPEDIRALMAQCHVFVLPSHGEGLAHEVVEALACGRPVVTTDVAGCRETIDEKVSGVLVPARDALALSAAIEGFLRVPDQLAWMSQASRATAERRFDANAVAGDMLEIMELVHRG